MSLEAHVRALALEAGFQTVGFASADPPKTLNAFEQWLERGFHGGMDYLPRSLPLRADLNRVLPGVQSAIVVTLNYAQPQDHRPGYPKISRYALGRDYHKVIRGKLRHMARALSAEHPEERFRAAVDSAPIFERELANRAGLGWFGKNTMLIDSRRGSWFFIGVLLTTLRLEPDQPAVGGCGTCTSCIDACPTGAIVFADGRWQVDARSCISYLTIEHRGEFKPGTQLHGWTFGCDVCQEVCPFNQARASQPQRGNATVEPAFLERRQFGTLHETLENEVEWDRATQGSAIRRAKWDGWVRNVRQNLKESNTESHS